MEQRFRYFLLFLLIGILLFLLYFVFMGQKQDIKDMESLLKCIEIQECKSDHCPPLPDYCPRPETTPEKRKTTKLDNPRTLRESSGIKTIEDTIIREKKDPEPKSQSLLDKIISNIKTIEDEKSPSTQHKRPDRTYSDQALKKAIQKQKRINKRKEREAKIRHKRRKQESLIERIDLTYIEIGFSYTLRNFFLTLPLIAFGMSLASLGLKQSAQTYGLLAVATAVSAAFVGQVVMKNYDYLGPYLFLLSGASLLLYAEQKEYVLPILGAVIGVFIGFTAGSDSPIHDKWPFIIGVIFACGFVLMIFSISTQLFNQTWSETIMNILGGGLIALSLIMFALELNGNTPKDPHSDRRSEIRILSSKISA